MAKKVKLGFAAVILRNVGVIGADNPTLSEVKAVSDVKLAPSFDSQEATTREGKGVKQEEPTLIGLELTGKVRVDDTDTHFLALDQATWKREPLDLVVLNGPPDEDGSRGWRCWWKNHAWEEDQGNDKVLMRDFSLKPCVGFTPKRCVVKDGAIVYVDPAADNP